MDVLTVFEAFEEGHAEHEFRTGLIEAVDAVRLKTPTLQFVRSKLFYAGHTAVVYQGVVSTKVLSFHVDLLLVDSRGQPAFIGNAKGCERTQVLRV